MNAGGAALVFKVMVGDHWSSLVEKHVPCYRCLWFVKTVKFVFLIHQNATRKILPVALEIFGMAAMPLPLLFPKMKPKPFKYHHK